jgi:Tfp pilus assembly protein FimT
MGIIVLLAALVGPAINAINGSGNLSKTASDISDLLQQARAYAMANNTYVYVAIDEFDANNAKLVQGNGRIAVAIVASKNGIRPAKLDGSGTIPVSKLQKFDNAHLATGEVGTSGNMERTTGAPEVVNLASQSATSPLTWSSGGGSTEFRKVIEFDPQGVARPQVDLATPGVTGKTIVGWIEIGLQPSHGGNVSNAANEKNVAAIQVDGTTGVVRLYRP